MDDKFSIEFEMGRLKKNLRLGRKVKVPKLYAEHALLSFIIMSARTYASLNDQGKTRLAGMIRAGLKDHYGLTSLQHEMETAAHLMIRGFDVTFSDIEYGRGFDFLARKEDLELEVECKTHSADLGRKIHRNRVYQLSALLLPHMRLALARHSSGQLVRAVIPDRLNGDTKSLEEITEKVAAAFETQSSSAGPEPCSTEFKKFSWQSRFLQASSMTENQRKEAIREHIQRTFGYEVGHSLVIANAEGRAAVVTVESKKPDRVLYALVEQLKKSIKTQLTGRRPAIIFVRFSDISESEIRSLAKSDENKVSSLKKATSFLLNRPDWNVVHSIAYSTPGHITLSDSGRGKTAAFGSGPAYFFPNPNNALVSDIRLKIFE